MRYTELLGSQEAEAVISRNSRVIHDLPYGVALILVVIAAGGATTLGAHDRVEDSESAIGPPTAFRDPIFEPIDDILSEMFPGYRADLAQQPSPQLVSQPRDWIGLDGHPIKCRTVSIAPSLTFWKVHESIRLALKPLGASILWSERLSHDNLYPPGTAEAVERDVMRLDLGYDKGATHTILFYSESVPTPVVTWETPDVDLDVEDLLGDLDQPTIALIVDDWGNGMTTTTAGMLTLDIPFTMAVLPDRPYSHRFALEKTALALPAHLTDGDLGLQSRIRLRKHFGCPVDLAIGIMQPRSLLTRRREVMLHLPMQPNNYPAYDPGPMAVMRSMSETEIRNLVDDALEQVPGATGVNNHMGSAATSDETTMDRVMSALQPYGLYFVDSMTTAQSVAYQTAREFDIPALRCRIFLDQRDPNEQEVRKQLDRCVAIAESGHPVVAICHPYPQTVAVLSRELPSIVRQGIRFVTVSELMAIKDAQSRRVPAVIVAQEGGHASD